MPPVVIYEKFVELNNNFNFSTAGYKINLKFINAKENKIFHEQNQI